MRFSERIGAVPSKPVQTEEIDAALRNRLWNYLKGLWDYLYDQNWEIAYERASEIVDNLGLIDKEYSSNIVTIKGIIMNGEWFSVYDLVEILIELLSVNEKPEVADDINNLLIEEKSGYRIIPTSDKDDTVYQVVPITAPIEISSIEAAGETSFDSVNQHITKALACYSDRQSPDYSNSIKESISAVESLCCHFTGNRKATLGQALKKLEEDGWAIHGSFKTALEKLYGYTSDEDGIRHGGLDSSKADAEDALFMLVSCSAFINYLIEKKQKLTSGK